MKLNLNIAHDLKPEELSEIVDLSKKADKPITQLILEAARELAAHPQAHNDTLHPLGKEE